MPVSAPGLSAWLLAGLVASSTGCIWDLAEGSIGDSGAEAYLGDWEAGQDSFPEPGTGVFTEVLFAEGDAEHYYVETALDGRAYEVAPFVDDNDISGEGEEVISLAAGGNPACAEAANQSYTFRWNRPYDFKFRVATTPPYLNPSNVERAITRAATNIATSRNDCGLADAVEIAFDYRGNSGRGVNINANSTCGTRDGHSVVAFGNLPAGIQAMACVWTKRGAGRVAIEADIRLNKNERWYVKRPANCRGKYDIESIMTHEFGHVFGLAHVSEATHPHLTMGTNIPTCNESVRTLGLGDVRGLRRKY